MTPPPRHDQDSHFLDLHGCSRAEAERRIARELHACRVRGATRMTVVTGRGFGNRTQEPVLREHLEAWLAGPEARRLGVLGFERGSRGGSLELRIARPGD